MKFFKLVEEVVKYHVDYEKGKVIAVVSGYFVPRCLDQVNIVKPDQNKSKTSLLNDFSYNASIRGIGKATCSKDDTFNEEVGKRLAYVKAKKQIMSICSNYCKKLSKRLSDISVIFGAEANRYKNAVASETAELKFIEESYLASKNEESNTNV